MIKHKYFSRALLTLVLAVTLSACGFHLRGNIPLPDGIKHMYIQAPSGTFKDQLEFILINAGAEIAGSASIADVVLNITEAETDRTVGTLDERGKANSFNLVFEVKYRLEDPTGKKIRKTSLKESRRYDFDPELVVETESEETDLLLDMEQDVALRIVRQLSSVTDHPKAPKAVGEVDDSAENASDDEEASETD